MDITRKNCFFLLANYRFSVFLFVPFELWVGEGEKEGGDYKVEN